MVKDKKYKIAFISLIGLLFCLFISYNLIFNERFNIKNHPMEKSFTSNELLSELKHKDDYLKLYVDKTIEIESNILNITYKYGKYTLILYGNEHETMIMCEIQEDQNNKIEQLKIGQNIKVKGVLKGVLLDVILLNCILTE